MRERRDEGHKANKTTESSAPNGRKSVGARSIELTEDDPPEPFRWRYRTDAMPLPRMTTRRWMIAVAAVALLIALGSETRRLIRLRYNYLQSTASHQRLKTAYVGLNARALAAVNSFREQARKSRAEPLSKQDPRVTEFEAQAHERRAQVAEAVAQKYQKVADDCVAKSAYHTRLEAKYRFAARFPWLPVPPDPPGPK